MTQRIGGSMNNADIRATWRYHNATKHSPYSVWTSSHDLDWANQPIPYKIYASVEPISLPRQFPPSASPALAAIAQHWPALAREHIPDLAALARLCYFSNGITKRRRYPGGETVFRAASATGALYHIELYLVTGDLPGLAAGVYHYGAHDHSVRQLRAGDFRSVLVEATGGEPSVTHAPAVLICTSTFWRNAWKYQARAYRHSFWDTGTILANLLAVASAQEIPARVVLGFADEPVNRLLDVDPQREAAISLVALGHTRSTPASAPPVAPLNLPTVPLSPREIDYPAIRAMHAASSLISGDEAAAWRDPLPGRPAPSPTGSVIPLQPLSAADLPAEPVESVILRRGSTRHFARESITFAQLSTMLDRATRDIPADFLAPGGDPLSDRYLLINAVEGLQPGTYALRRDRQALELLQAGEFRDVAGELALGQRLGADAAANLYFLTNLTPVLEHFGNRGYRAAQLAAAITAGKLYLAAYALRLGATGLTFFDDEVTACFSPHGADESAMFLLALGRPRKLHRRSFGSSG